MQQKTILLLFGGESAEHDVSVMSARNVIAAVDAEKFKLELCYITKAGEWRYVAELPNEIEDTIGEQLMPMLGQRKFVTEAGHEIAPEVILPILHGPHGEDGTVQGLASLLHIPIVGCGVAASAICMDKTLTKELLAKVGIPIVPYKVLFAHEAAPEFTQLSQELGNVLFVKPANMGSSVGVSKATNQVEFETALQEAFRFDIKVLIERGIEARELEIAMLGGGLEEIQASGVGEIKAAGEFYSYDSKYSESSTSETIIPAALDEATTAQLRDFAIKAFAAVGGKGLSRIDFFIDKTNGDIYLNEINTLPGFTNISMYPKLWNAEGISYSQLITRLVQNALEK